MNVSGNIVDVVAEVIYPGTLEIQNGIIVNIVKETKHYDTYIIPGFIDSHVHVESSMLVPSEFARLAVSHGTVGVVCDPHEIANVLGIEGVRYMMENGSTVPFKFFFGVPSCVPATPFETSGAHIGVPETEMLLKDSRTYYLSEMMNFPGVINGDKEVMAKINVAGRYGKPIDGHAPGLRGNALKRYVEAGITTDHECSELEEAREKIALGMKILIREGSAAKNLDALSPLLGEFPHVCMLCSDDMHPDDLVAGHINLLVKRAVHKGFNVMHVLKCASLNPVVHYGLNVGLLQQNQPADFVVIDNLTDFTVLKTVINGVTVSENGKTRILHRAPSVINRFSALRKTPEDFRTEAKSDRIRVIEAVDGQIVTGSIIDTPRMENGYAVSDTVRDILKIAVVNRYEDKPPALGFIKNYGLQKGAIASSVAHDSHNVVVVGVSEEAICDAVNLIIGEKGGISLVSETFQEVLPLPVAGIMSDRDAYVVAKKYAHLNALSKELGATFVSPYMTLSFMALLVIPLLKLSDRGLFDSSSFSYTDLFV